MPNRQVIAVAGAGDLGKYICEELHVSEDFDVVVLSRTRKHQWCDDRQIPVYPTDYSVASLKSIFNLTCATTIISFVGLKDSAFIDVHSSLLIACQQSERCKRLIPCEWIGDSEAFPNKPDFYAKTRAPFRSMLRAQKEVEWTLFNPGWLADYFLPESKTYVRHAPEFFPVNSRQWCARVYGAGDQPQSWTSSREVGKAVVELCRADRGTWESHTYVAGEWSTFDRSIGILEEFYDRPMPRINQRLADLEDALIEMAGEEKLTDKHEELQIEEMMVKGHLNCPKEKTLRQRKQFFPKTKFSTLKELLKYAQEVEFV